MENRKSHKALTIFAPVLCFIYAIIASIASGQLEEKIPGIPGVIISNLLALAFVLGIFFCYRKIHKKYQLGVSNGFNLTMREKRILILLVLAFLLKLIINHNVAYLIYNNCLGENYSIIAYPVSEFKEDMLAAVHAIIIAPLLEELCFRIVPISLCQKKATKLIMLIATSLLFGWSHGKNFWMTLIDGTLLGLIFLWTNRPIISIACHMAHNFFSFIMGIVAFFGGASIYVCEKKPTLVLFDVMVSIIVSGVIIAIGIVIFMATKNWKDNPKSELN